MPQAAKLWTMRMDETLSATTGKYVSATVLHKLESGVECRVPTKQFRAEMAKLIDERGLQVAEGDPRKPQTALEMAMATPLARKASRAMITAQAPFYDVVLKVIRWVRKRTQGARGQVTLTAPMIGELQHGIAKGGRTTRMVEAALMLLLQHNQDVTVEIQSLTQGRYPRQLWQDVSDTLKCEAGMSTAETTKVSNQIVGRVCQMADSLTALDFGEGWGGVKEGLKRQLRTYGIDKVRQAKGKKEGKSVPDMMLDFATQREDLQETVKRRAKLTDSDLVLSHFSPCCKSRTILQRIEAAVGRGKGVHAGKKEAKRDREAVTNIVKTIVKYRKRVPRWSFTLEQPAGSSLRNAKVMVPLGKPREVSMCAYGYTWQKPTIIWTNLGRHWRPKDPKIHCPYCKEGRKHPRRVIRRDKNDSRPGPMVPGFSGEAARNRIHPDVAEEWATAALARWNA